MILIYSHRYNKHQHELIQEFANDLFVLFKWARLSCTVLKVWRVSEDKGSVLVKDGADQDVACDDALQSDDIEDIEDDALRFANKEQDFISVLSCTPGQLTSMLASIIL